MTLTFYMYSSGGSKTTKAREWSIPIVNHTWLEDCFVQWRNLAFATVQCIRFSAGVNFAMLLGEKGVGRSVGEDEEKIAAEARAGAYREEQASDVVEHGQRRRTCPSRTTPILKPAEPGPGRFGRRTCRCAGATRARPGRAASSAGVDPQQRARDE